MWSDGDLKQYMAVTAHWMEQTVSSTNQQQVNLRADLIGFIHVPGSHTGDHLAEVFLFILNRMGLAKKVLFISFNYIFNLSVFFSKVGWVTTDNASNNTSFMAKLKVLLRRQNLDNIFSSQLCHIK
jgi:hypothetical protein